MGQNANPGHGRGADSCPTSVAHGKFNAKSLDHDAAAVTVLAFWLAPIVRFVTGRLQSACATLEIMNARVNPMTKPSGSRPFRVRLTGFLLLVSLAAILAGTHALWRFDAFALDWQLGLLSGLEDIQRADASVVVVGIDDADVREFGVPVATLHRQLGQFLEALALAEPRAVGVDVVLPEISFDRIQPGLDVALARGIVAVRAAAPLVLGVGARSDGTTRPLHPLFANLVGPEGLGSVFLVRDADGVVRRFDERIGVGDQVVPSLAGRLARRIGVPVREGIIPTFHTSRLHHVPLRDVLAWHRSGDIPRLKNAFSGKVVLLGSLLAHEDQHQVPLSLAVSDSGNTTHGVFIHAMQLQGILDDRLILDVPAVSASLIAILLACVWWARPGKLIWLALCVSVCLLTVASLFALQGGWAVPTATWNLALVGGVGGRAIVEALLSGAERRRLRRAFDGAVSPGVLKEILDGRLHPSLAGERREVCVLFSDIRSFTTLSENLQPEVVTNILNRYFERMASCVHRHDGTLDKFIGDGIMAFYGAPHASPDPCAKAFASAVEMLYELELFNREQESLNQPTLVIGIGLHFGHAFVGYIGAKARNEYSAIGDTVNTASRLEGLTKDLGFPIVMSTPVRERLHGIDGIRDLGECLVKGRAAIQVFGWKRPADGELR